jgi:tRNA(Ile)-lysidine synthase
MAPFGMKGSKKIQDILVDAKVPRQERPGLPLFESGGEIVWLPGYRVAAARRVTDPGAMNLQLCVEPLHGGNGDAVT